MCKRALAPTHTHTNMHANSEHFMGDYRCYIQMQPSLPCHTKALFSAAPNKNLPMYDGTLTLLCQYEVWQATNKRLQPLDDTLLKPHVFDFKYVYQD